MPHDGLPGAISEAGGKQVPAPRCRACQLQLCKSRREAPHAALIETLRDEGGGFVRYVCQSCSTSLRRSEDLGLPGWSVAR